MTRIRSAALTALVVLTALVGLVVPATSASAVPTTGGTVSRILVWGDSMTLVWPGYLAEMVDVPVVNMGVGGETVQETKVRFDAWVAANPTLLASTGHLCWCGHVNGNRKNNNLNTVASTTAAMAGEVPADRFMPIGLTNGPDSPAGSAAYRSIVEGVNVDLATEFGGYYAEVRHYLVTDGLRVAGLTPTPTDEANIAVDVPPASLRTSGTGNPAHLNDTGRRVTATRMNDLVRGVGWVYTNPDLLATGTTVTSTSNPATSGTPIRLQATVANVSAAPGVPTGTVTFQRGRKVLGTFALRNGVATSSAGGTLPLGDNVITAVYNGDADFATSSGSFTQVINPRP